MNLSALKTFAPEVRRQLMEAVGRKLDYVLTADTADLRAAATQVAHLRSQADADRNGLIERVAYTWFNRLAALRFIDARDWHPFRCRVVMPANAEETQPELLKLARAGALPPEFAPFIDLKRLNDLLDGHLPSPDPQGEVYRHLVLAACRYYHDLMPFLFEELDDETELLLPDDLLTEHSIAQGFRTEISDEDCSEVELLGWLYQFYISEKKDQVMARKSAVPSEDIPSVTQLFTPHWIVCYLVENSLGRLWLLNHPDSRLREYMPYYIEGEAETDFLKITKPEEIRLCDPAVGSGHMLTYAFDLLTVIYEEQGYAPTEIPALILRYNLHGLEICPRAAQLAELALVFKAREKSRRFFQPEHIVQPHIIELCDVCFTENELSDYFHALGLNNLLQQSMIKLFHQFKESKTFGSLIQPCLDEQAIVNARRAIEEKDLDGQLFLRETHLKVLRVLEQAEALTQRYHIAVANPPYMGKGSYNASLKRFSEQVYPETRQDLFSMFIDRCLTLPEGRGFVAIVAMHSWMFLSSLEGLRKKLLHTTDIITLAHLGPRAFDSISGEVVQTAAFVLTPQRTSKRKTIFQRAVTGANSEAKAEMIRSGQNRFVRDVVDFNVIPSFPLAYWLSETVLGVFKRGKALAELFPVRAGMATGDNPLFVRLWHEISLQTLGFGFGDRDEAKRSGKKWFPFNKGGEFRKWYGNNDFVVNYRDDGAEIKARKDSDLEAGRITPNNSKCWNQEFYFKESVCWTKVGTGTFCVRHSPAGTIASDASNGIFAGAQSMEVAGLLCSPISETLIAAMNPTLNVQVGNVASLPWLSAEIKVKTTDIHRVCRDAVSSTKADWDNFETSWDFCNQPLLRPGIKGATLEASWRNWEAQSTAAIRRMQELETENNRLFIAAYGLDGELPPEVPEAKITLARAEARRDMAAFLSYAVGCMMGRYSLDAPGPILANAGDTLEQYIANVGKPLDQLTFVPDEDGIIPVLEGEWFEDDIVARTRDFLRASFGDATLEANIRFIEESLDKDLRKYFLTDFYKDHLKTYKKRPIYWMFQSPKKGFNALVYLHRYTKDTPNRLLSSYLREFLHKLRARLEHLDHLIASEATPAREVTKARKESDQIKKSLRECEDWEREVILPLAQQRIELDLDDGVKVNYLKLGEALAPIAGLAAKEED